jgi:hypothetical protein
MQLACDWVSGVVADSLCRKDIVNIFRRPKRIQLIRRQGPGITIASGTASSPAATLSLMFSHGPVLDRQGL